MKNLKKLSRAELQLTYGGAQIEAQRICKKCGFGTQVCGVKPKCPWE
ncbi:bacteriocin-like protein [Chryseobacterium sp. PMSZPI]